MLSRGIKKEKTEVCSMNPALYWGIVFWMTPLYAFNRFHRRSVE